MADSIARHLPDDVIVADESATAGGSLWRATEGGPPHDWLTLTGGSIGQGLPVATGAALACPDRRILCLQGDGGAMYTPQALWTQAREDLDVVTVILSNRRYAILELELARLEAGHGARRGRALLDLAGPPLDWVALASAEGVPGERAESAEAFDAALGRALAGRGPRLIEAAIEAGPIESFARAG
jgi:acetolactate synthase-1/2/3 large subunit